MNSKKLDQFYTNPEIAKKCYDIIQENINIEEYFLLEPSAGTGSFSNLFHNNSISIDLDPKKGYMIKQNFLDFNLEEFNIDKNIITIGNPPFGKNSSLAIKFFNKAAEFSEYICFVLPKTFKKTSVINKLNDYFYLINEIELEKNSFIFNNKPYNVPCIFQIWQKGNNKRNKIININETKFFNFTKKENADIAIRRVGGLAGKVIENFQQYKEPSHYYLKISNNFDKNEIIDTLKESYKELNNISKNSAGNPSLTKPELITIFEKNYKIYKGKI